MNPFQGAFFFVSLDCILVVPFSSNSSTADSLLLRVLSFGIVTSIILFFTPAHPFLSCTLISFVNGFCYTSECGFRSEYWFLKDSSFLLDLLILLAR